MEEKKSAIAHILSSMKTPWCITIEKTQYNVTTGKVDEINKLLTHSADGAPHTSFGDPLIHTSFGASLYKASGKAADFLAKLRQSFPGKAIIIDRWATWCGTCVDEMPHSKELQEEAKDMPVVLSTRRHSMDVGHRKPQQPRSIN
jgi:thiol-disulfide isomerase/thioredoxin